MLSQNKKSSSMEVKGTIKNWSPNASIHRVIEVIENNIEYFIKEYTENVIVEKDLNQNFSLCMNTKTKDELFTFSNGYKDIILATPHEVDFGLVLDGKSDAFFAIEAKRLDTSLLGNARKKEYVIGKLGGIERFKMEKHGANLTHVGMIGYVQTDDFDVWFEKINSWIDEEIVSPTSSELIWKKKDKLSLDKKDKIFHTYLSEHRCKTKEIDMYHIWLDLT